jgi:hypothetical protein
MAGYRDVIAEGLYSFTPKLRARVPRGIAKEVDDDVEKVIAALDAAGYCIVPMEPTEAMRGAGTGENTRWRKLDDGSVVVDTYRAMLAARPKCGAGEG